MITSITCADFFCLLTSLCQNSNWVGWLIWAVTKHRRTYFFFGDKRRIRKSRVVRPGFEPTTLSFDVSRFAN